MSEADNVYQDAHRVFQKLALSPKEDKVPLPEMEELLFARNLGELTFMRIKQLLSMVKVSYDETDCVVIPGMMSDLVEKMLNSFERLKVSVAQMEEYLSNLDSKVSEINRKLRYVFADPDNKKELPLLQKMVKSIVTDFEKKHELHLIEYHDFVDLVEDLYNFVIPIDIEESIGEWGKNDVTEYFEIPIAE